MSRRRALAWLLFAVSNVAHALGWVLVADSEVATTPLDVAAASVLVLLPGVGLLIATRRPANAIGWLLSGAGLLLAATHLAYGWAAFALTAERDLPGGMTAAWASNWLYLPGIFGVPPMLFLLFPDGRPMSRRWGAVVALSGVSLVAVTVGQAVAPGPLADSPVANLDNPYARPDLAEAAGGAAWTALLLTIALAGLSLVVRYRRADGDARLQLRWVAFSAALFTLACATSAALRGTDLAGVGPFLVIAAYLTFPLAAGTAILRYRLYDIDLVINRALVYGSLTTLLGGFYLGSVLLLQVVLGPVTAGSDLAVAASTLAAAALFRPARSRIQAGVDRRFFRRRYDAVRTIEDFVSRLRHEVDLEAVGADLRATVRSTVQPASVSLWLRGTP